MYAADANASSDDGVPAALGALDGGPWGAPEFNMFSGSYAQWTAGLHGVGSFKNNRLLIVQNYESIQHDAVACSAVVDFVRSGVQNCLVDAPAQLSSTQLNASAWTVSWTLQFVGCQTDVTVRVLASTFPSTVPSGELAVPDVFESPTLPGAVAGSTLLTLSPGFSAQYFFWQVVASVTVGSQGVQQRMASDASLLVPGK